MLKNVYLLKILSTDLMPRFIGKIYEKEIAALVISHLHLFICSGSSTSPAFLCKCCSLNFEVVFSSCAPLGMEEGEL